MNPSQGLPSLLSYFLVSIVILGLIIYFQKIFLKKGIFKDNCILNVVNLLKISLVAALLMILVASFIYQLFVFGEIGLFALLFVLYWFLVRKKSGSVKENLKMDVMFLSWFGAYLIFQSILPLKVDDTITMAPALAYFIVLGLK